MFKKGDMVICINSVGSDFLIKNITYIVTKEDNDNHCIQVSGDENGWYRERFILDIKEQRKRKLNRIYEN